MQETGSPPDRALGKAGLALLAWLVATVGIGAALRHGQPASIGELLHSLSTGVALNVCLALLVLVLATRGLGLSGSGFRWPQPRMGLRLLWLPLLVILPVYALAVAIGLPPGPAIAFMLVNTFLIALSEEWMFRGILLRALWQRLSPWPAVLLTSAAFGAVHVLNAFAYGDVLKAAGQAVAAAMSGLLLGALRIRSGSIWPAVGFHMVWNLGLLLVTFEAARQPLPEGPLPPAAYLVPLALVMPNLIYALYLLRRLHRMPAPAAAPSP